MAEARAKPGFMEEESIKSIGTEERKVIFASSLGTVFEWYDFYLYAVLAPFFAALFFHRGTRPRHCSLPSPPTLPASSCARSARWSSVASATSWDASTRSS
jgi:hypothetical protein